MVRATVASVGSEVREGKVRVELTVHPDSTSRIPMQHGLPGAVEVAVEEVSPLSLILRAAGQLLAGKQNEGESSLKPGQDNGR
jgi:membrane fusion protein (multidrug efflux system)